MNKFAASRDLLGAMRSALGDRGLVSTAWDGDKLRVQHAMPETGKRPMVMTFDGPEDYLTDTDELVSQLAKASAEHFGITQSPPAGPSLPGT
jgi:hypothetical protein